jgi:hypothetical protein
MKRLRIVVAVALAGAFALSNPEAPQAADRRAPLTIKPLHGVSFDLGTKHAVSYYSTESGTCKLVLTLAAEPSWDDIPAFEATRFEVAIPAGRERRYHSGEGSTVDFACQNHAETMTVMPEEQVAADTGPAK